jgi:uncharacterized repeat protein (TIGR03803 family)
MTKLRTLGMGPLVPPQSRKAVSIGKLSVFFVICSATVISAPAQNFSTLLIFDGTDGAGPRGALVQGTDGNFYGTTSAGGAYLHGTIFKITRAGVLTTLHSFNNTDGTSPCAALVQGTDGNFYGTTSDDGINGYGTVFKITAAGALTTLHNFNNTDGANPCAALVQGTDGNFYGTTVYGGAIGSDSCPSNTFEAGGCGTVFKITPAGALTTLHSFNLTDGNQPDAALVQAIDGNFYGTTPFGGASSNPDNLGLGTVFKISPGGALTTLHSFTLKEEGHYPYAGLIQAANGNFYGTTSQGGAIGYGTVFTITPGGKLTTLHSFDDTDGGFLYGGLVQATDGNLYGTATGGGDACAGSEIAQCGTVFKITAAGALTTLHKFQPSGGGFNPYVGVIQATSGKFYGPTAFGGDENCYYPGGCGTVFRFDLGLRPFVSLRRLSGKVGQIVQILGQGFTGATRVSFNGTAASFTVKSDTYLTTIVPARATTGFVTVTEPGVVLKSNQKFCVTSTD